PDAVGAGVQPRSDLERTIAAAWCEVLGIGQVGVRDNFFDIGGNSVAATRLHSLLEGRLPHPPTMVDLFRAPSVRALAGLLTPPPAAGTPAGAPAGPGGPEAAGSDPPAPSGAERGRRRAQRRLAARGPSQP
ncbi:phosphopantetheine-binding protein, partial [Frankia tisae]